MREQDKKIRQGQARAYRKRMVDPDPGNQRPVGKLREHKFMQHYLGVLKQCDRDIAAEHAWRNTPR